MNHFLNRKNHGMLSSSYATSQAMGDRNYPGMLAPHHSSSEMELRGAPPALFQAPVWKNHAIQGPLLAPPLTTVHPRSSAPHLFERNSANVSEEFHGNELARLPYLQYPMPKNGSAANMKTNWMHSPYQYEAGLGGIMDNNQINSGFLVNESNLEELEKMTGNLEELLNGTEAPNYLLEGPSSSLNNSNSGAYLADGSPPLSTSSSKQRMRWTPELHDRFIDAVSQLGGAEKATPKGILTIMKVDGLTIFQVKSHLQKFRTSRYKPDSPEGMTGNSSPIDELLGGSRRGVGITDALKQQMELQKLLYEQLESQRKLQLRIEEQGRCLQSMLEKQQKEFDRLKAASNLENSDLCASSDFASIGKSLEDTMNSLRDCIGDTLYANKPVSNLGPKRKMAERDEAAVVHPAPTSPSNKRLKDSDASTSPRQ